MGHKTLIERIKDAGQALVAVAAISAFLGGAAIKAWGWALSGPNALTKAEKLEKEVRRIKRQSRFTVTVLEKMSREKYDWRGEERDLAREEGDEQR